MNHTDPDKVPAVWQVGDGILDRYEVQQVFTGGGMGLVYRVHHRDWAMDLAVKSPRPEFFQTRQHIENFEREAETWVKLGLHPHTVSCYYVRRLGGIPRIFTEFVDGGSLADWIRSRRLYEGGPDRAMERILDIAIQFAWGLHYAHEQGLIHQDVKPGNVLVNTDGTVKVTDFGLAKARALAGETPMASAGQSILVTSGGMTPAYCSPEQANGKPLSRKTDIWSWAVSVLEMMTGEVTWATGLAAPSALEDFYEGQSPNDPINTLLAGCLNYSADKRFGDFREIAKTLQNIYLQTTGQAHRRKAPAPAEIDADSMNNRAVSFLDLGMQDEAEECFDKALQRHPAHPHAAYNRGLVLWRDARLTDTELITQLQESQQSHASDWQCQYLLGLAHMERMDSEAAIQALEGALQLGGGKQVEIQLETVRQMASKWPRCIRAFEGHTSYVISVAVSTDGFWAVSGSSDTTMRLWELATGRCTRTFEGHSDKVTAVALSTDGCWALSGSHDTTLRLWELATGHCAHVFNLYSPVSCVAFSADGHWVLAGSHRKTVDAWELMSGKYARIIFEGHTGFVNCVTSSADGQCAISGSYDGTLRAWDVKTGQCVKVFEGHRQSVTSAAISFDGLWVLSGSWDGTLRLWEVATCQCVRVIPVGRELVQSVAWSKDGRWALVGRMGGSLQLWEFATGRCVRSFEKHSDGAESAVFTRSGRSALWGGGDSILRLFQIEPSSRSHFAFPAPMTLCRASSSEAEIQKQQQFFRLMSNARKAASGGRHAETLDILRVAREATGYRTAEQALQLWNLTGLHCTRTGFKAGWCARVYEMRGGVCSSVLSADGLWALSGSPDRTLRLWNIENRRCERTFLGHDDMVVAVALSANGQWALSGSRDHTLRLWSLATGQCVHVLKGHKNLVTSVALSPDGRWALSGSHDHTLRLWDVTTGWCIRVLEDMNISEKYKGIVGCIAFSPDGSSALSCRDHIICLWQVATGRRVRVFEPDTKGVNSIAFSSDGRWLLFGSFDNSLSLWDVDTGQYLRTFTGHSMVVDSVAFSPDNRWAISGSSDNTLRLWDVETGQCLRVFKGHASAVNSVTFSADGRWVLSGGGDSTLRLWELDWEFDFPGWADWDVGVMPYLKHFLILHTPYAASLPQDSDPTEDEVIRALTREGTPKWTEEDFQQLLHTLRCVGYGWLRPENVQQELTKMAIGWKKPVTLF